MARHSGRVFVVIMLLGTILLASTATLAQSAEPAGRPALYVVEQKVGAGGSYRLAGGTWQVDGTASGAGYRLQVSGGTPEQGAGCCCTFIPCVPKGIP